MSSAFLLPSYEESQKIDYPEPETGPVYCLHVVYDSQSILGHNNLDGKNFVFNILLELGTPPLWSSITYALDQRNNRSNPPKSKVLNIKTLSILCKCKDLEKITFIRDKLYFKNLKSNDIPNGCRLLIWRENFVGFHSDKKSFVLNITIRNIFTRYDRSFRCLHYVSPKAYRYSMEVKYDSDHVAIGWPKIGHLICTESSLKPEFITIWDTDKVVEHQKLSLSGSNDFFTVVYRSPSLENLNQIKEMLVAPCYRRFDDSSSCGKVSLYMHTFRDAFELGRDQYITQARKMYIDAQHIQWHLYTQLGF